MQWQDKLVEPETLTRSRPNKCWAGDVRLFLKTARVGNILANCDGIYWSAELVGWHLSKTYDN